MDTILLIVALAFILEAVVETVKLAYEPKTRSVDRVVAIVFGIAGSIAFGFSIFKVVGFPDPVVPYVGEVITGFVVARGGNFVHDLLNRVQGKSTAEKAAEAKPVSAGR